ncbi:MAG: adenylyltransferase/cytidyltransferase family protein [Lachnospiraceae bacterium]|nr:adenylyltransferase/cytidyltransferase family protein [Lachnospiraceae bacterium]
MKRKVGKMNKELAFDILRQAYDLGTREVGFYATGEPFLIVDLAEYISYAKSLGYTYVYLTSNGSLATPERIREVIGAGLDSIKFSINAPERELYQFIHGRDDFDKVVEHLKYLHEYRNEIGGGFKIYVTGILTKYTEHLQDKYHELFDSLCDQVVFKYVYNQGGYMPEINDYLRCECDTAERRKCNLPFDAISVTYEGYLSVENADYENMLVVADLNQVSLKDGWYGDKMKEIRRKFMEDDLGGTLCDGCVHRCLKPAKPLTEECSDIRDYVFDDSLVRKRVEAYENNKPVVYVPMAVDILHPGHINILKIASQYGRVIVGLFTDEAIASYKRVPYMTYEERKDVVENIKGVSDVIPQKTRDYEENLRLLKPRYMVHGTDWRVGPLADVRQKAINILKEWGGEIVEPEYTKGVSSSLIQQKIRERKEEEKR